MHNHNKLLVYQKALKLIPAIYNLTKLLPHTEKYGLISQLNRAAVSVSSNIAEGASRKSDKEFEYYLSVAAGSCNEMETQLKTCINLNFLKEEDAADALNQIDEIQKILRTLRKKFSN